MMACDKDKCFAECLTSLHVAIVQAHGTLNEKFLDMSLLDFIVEIAAPNSIQFIYKEKH